MASPFDKFRKKQKVMLAVLGVLCMFGFIVGPMIMDLSGGTSQGQGDAVVRIFDETLNEQNLNDLLRERQIASGFVSFLRGDRQAVFGQVNPQSSVIVEALAREADSLGVVVSDDAINKFIDDSNFLQHTRARINEELSNANWDPEVVFRALRRELMCMQARMLYLPGPDAAVVSPARLWDYYQRLHRRAKIDALAIDANDFLDEVGDPPEDELLKLFNEFKNFPSDPNSADPGFAQLATATVEYIRADYDKFYKAAESEITEEQLKEYYENQKATQYPYTGFVLDEDAIVAPTAAGDPVPGQEDESSEDAEAGTDADQSSDDGTSDGADSGDGNTDAGSGDAGDGNAGDGNSGNGDGNVQETYPVSLVDESQDDQGDDTQGDDTQGDATQGDADQGDANQGDANQADAGQGDANQDSSPANTTEPNAIQELDNRSIIQIADEFRIPTDILGGPDPEFDPFWKVRDRILEKLANEKATERIEAGLTAVRAPLEAFKAELVAFQNTRGDQTDPDNAPRRQQVQEQVAQAATEHGLDFVTDAAERVNPYEFGEIEELQDVSSLAGQSFRSLMESIFSPTAGVYELIDGTDSDNNKILAWKTADTDAFQPEKLSAVRQQVVDAWKMREAKKIAKAKAEEIAEKVEGGEELDEFVTGDNKVLHPEPFTWYTQNYDPSIITPQMAAQFGINFPAYSITEVDELERVSNEFMEATFELQESDTGVATNMPETIYYVVTVNRYDYQTGLGGTAEEDARRDFLLTDPNRLADLYALDYSNLQGGVFTYLQEEHIEWLVPTR